MIKPSLPCQADLLDHFVFSTEGHLIPPLPSRDGRGPSLPAQADIPASCHSVCSARKHRPGQQPLHEAFTLLHVDEGLDIIRPRRCMACVEVVKALAELKGVPLADFPAAARTPNGAGNVSCAGCWCRSLLTCRWHSQPCRTFGWDVPGRGGG